MPNHACFPNLRRRTSGRWLARVALLLTTLCLFLISVAFREPYLNSEFVYLQQLQSSAKSLNFCQVPQLDPWDPLILKYYEKQTKLECTAVQPPMVSADNGQIKFDAIEIKRYNAKCSIVPFSKSDDDEKVKYGKSIEVDLSVSTSYEFPSEFVEVNCVSTGLFERSIYSNHFHHLRAESVNIRNRTIESSSDSFPSVLMIGIDSMSYGNFLRQMPLTHRVMQNMNFKDMKNHVKIGDNTYANWIAILTGKRGTATKEFPNELPDEWNIFFDEFPLVWQNFSDSGYATLFAEDRPDIGTFNYFGKLFGFKNLPTDHYFRTYWLAAFWSYFGLRSKPFCYDSRPKHQIQIEYLESFINVYRKKRYFAFFWNQDMSHDYLNAIGKTDEDYANFLTRNSKALEDTIIMFFSDHGHRYDTIRETVIGRLEARLPFLSIRLPESIRQKYPNIAKNLAFNSKTFTAQFDLYETLLSIAKGSFMRNDQERKSTKGYSLFYPVPVNRTCIDAGVPDDYCPCVSELQIPAKDAREPANALIAYLNGLFDKFDAEELLRWDSEGRQGKSVQKFKCQKLEISSIKYSSVRLPPSKVIDDPQTGNSLPKTGVKIEYRIVVEAKPPSNAQIEGVVVKDLDSGAYIPSEEIERNNKYGNTSHCVTDRTLKKICHCLSV